MSMATPSPEQRLLPCLLDRLTDQEPAVGVESRERRVMTLREYQEKVRRDLEWLLNSVSHWSGDRLERELPAAAGSVLNYGLPDISGLTASGLDEAILEQVVRKTVQRFEPRILPGSLSVTVSKAPEAMNRKTICFEIRGDLWAEPMPDALYFKSELDLQTGRHELKDQLHG
jgi:type VI secretion system protein ImpF